MRDFVRIMLLLASTLGILGCASYKPVSLPKLQAEFAPYSATVDGVTLCAKSFTDTDCKRYFDRDIRAKGYQPIQLTILNETKGYIIFSPDGVSLPVVPAEEVARKVHTSTAGRATAYGVGALFIWPLAIPAIVDGVGSSKANAALDQDFGAKTVGQLVIQPYATHNGVIFVPTSEYRGSFDVTMVEKETRTKLQFQVRGLSP